MKVTKEWISVNEQLPEEYENVLIFGHNISIGWYAKSIYPEIYFWDIECKTYVAVITHWMPLPTPP